MTLDHLLTCVSLVITGFFVYGTFSIDAKLGRIEEHLERIRGIANSVNDELHR